MIIDVQSRQNNIIGGGVLLMLPRYMYKLVID